MDYKIPLNADAFIDSINEENYDDIALSVFKYQSNNNVIYRDFLKVLGKDVSAVTHVTDIPFLPISFFKTHSVVSGGGEAELLFESSKTTGDTPSRHLVTSAHLYKKALLKGFEQFYGSPSRYAILALLPSYLERSDASLVYMAETLMAESKHPSCGFYLDEWQQLANVLRELEAKQQPVILLGVTFALLDFAEQYSMHLQYTTVMETGGMKGRKEEWTRGQVHDFLKQQWGVGQVHSEYGMTELLSQAYALKEGIFQPSLTMKVFVRDINDPFDIKATGAGCLNIVDLANLHSCSFIATDDIGKMRENGSFEVLGRIDHSALRGCNLMVL